MMAGIEAIVKGSCMKLSLLGYAKDALKILFFVGVKATSSMLIKLWKNCGKGEKEVAMGSSFMGSMVKLWRIGIAITRLNLNFTRFKINSALDTIFLGNV